MEMLTKAEKKQRAKERRTLNRINNREEVLLKEKLYREKNKEIINARHRKWRLENPEKYAEARARYRKKRKNIVYANNAERRARKFRATIPMKKEEKEKIAEIYKIAIDAKKTTGYDWEVDHIVPLSKGGLHKLSNLQVVPAEWNAKKNNLNSEKYW
jgi:5-methylcytosine-specific restriction endonuclease McrA